MSSWPGLRRQGALGRQPLIEEDIRSLLAEVLPRGPLPILLLQGVDPEWRAVVYVVRARAGGFGIVAPLLESVQAALDQIVDDDGEAAVLLARRSVATETVRRRATGSVDVFLADVPWSGLPYFRRSGGLPLTQGSVQTIEADSIAVRPSRDAAETAFGEWVAEAGLDETMQEYLTAEEEEAGPLAAEPEAVGGIGDPAAQLAALQERLEALQRQVDDVPRPAPEPPMVDRAPGPGRARALFAAEPGPLSAQDWQTLRQLAGGAPPRIGGPERAVQQEREDTGNILTEADLGAAVADDELQALALGNQDPLQKILAAQTLLLKRVLPRPVDALSAALQGVGSEQGSSSSGVRGHTAREAYLRQLEDHRAVASAILENAAAELGISATNAHPGLLREFLDKKVALSEHRTLGYLATFMAHGWQAARESGNVELEAWMGRGVMAIEQMILDNGRLQIGWLLTGCPEPVFPPNAQLKRQGSMRPFAKLAKASWAAACLAYVKDLDYLEGRLRAAREKGSTSASEIPPGEPQAKAKWRPKNRKQNEGGAGES